MNPTWWSRPFTAWRTTTESVPPQDLPPVRTAPAWQTLPPLQRTVGDLDTTAGLDGFTSSLATSGDPMFTRPLDLLCANDAHRLPVLDIARPARASEPEPSGTTTYRNRTWGPNLATAQRARLSTEPTVQRTPDVELPPAEFFPVEVSTEEESAVDIESPTTVSVDAMVQAPPPQERRVLDVVRTPIPAVDRIETPHAPSAGADPAQSNEVTSEPPRPTAPTIAAPVQRSVSEPATTSAASPQLSVSARGVFDDAESRPVRHVASVQRAPADVAPAIVALPAAHTAAPAQRATKARHETSTAVASSSDHDTPEAASTPGPTLTPMPTVSAAVTPPPADHDEPHRESSAVQRMPVVDDVAEAVSRPAPRLVVHDVAKPMTASALRSATTTVETVQRMPVVDDVAEPVSTPTPQPTITGVESMQRAEPVVVQEQPQFTPPPISAIAVHPGTSAPRPVGTPPTAPSTPAVVQRTSAGRRLVVLPPARTESDAAPTADLRVESSRSVLFESGRELGLQRMFEFGPVERSEGEMEPVERSAGEMQPLQHSDRHIRPVQRLVSQAPIERSDRPAKSPAPVHLQASRAPQHETPFFTAPYTPTPTPVTHDEPQAPPHYDPATNTITFASPTVQREADAPPEPESPPAVTDSVQAAAPVTTAAPDASHTSVEDLVNRLYDPLAARLRAELWMDRERAGLLMDLDRR